MSVESVLYDVKDHIATITFNRPHRMNAFIAPMYDDVIHAIDLAENDPDVRVVVFTGAGRTYCSGQDLDSGDKFGRQVEDMTQYRDRGGKMSLRIYNMRKPSIAAINGHAIGVGLSMTLPMDIRVVSKKAKVGFVFTRRGIINEACSSYFLPRLVGLSKAAELVMTGRTFLAEEEASSGLFTYCVVPEMVLEKAYSIAHEIAGQAAPVSVALARALIYRNMSASHPMQAHELESMCMFWTARSADSQEGISAFLEKRPPDWKLSSTTDMPPFYPWWPERGFRQEDPIKRTQSLSHQRDRT